MVAGGLQFEMASRSHTGVYTCVASNSNGTASASATVEVHCEWGVV